MFSKDANKKWLDSPDGYNSEERKFLETVTGDLYFERMWVQTACGVTCAMLRYNMWGCSSLLLCKSVPLKQAVKHSMYQIQYGHDTHVVTVFNNSVVAHSFVNKHDLYTERLDEYIHPLGTRTYIVQRYNPGLFGMVIMCNYFHYVLLCICAMRISPKCTTRSQQANCESRRGWYVQ